MSPMPSAIEIGLCVVIVLAIAATLVYKLWPRSQAAQVIRSYGESLKPEVIPLKHPARSYADWLEDFAKDRAAIADAELHGQYLAEQIAAARAAAYSLRSTPLPAPSPSVPKSPASS